MGILVLDKGVLEQCFNFDSILFSEERKRLSFTISDLEEYVLSLCPYRPLCLNSIFEADNESSIMLKDNYESTGITKSCFKSNHAVRGSLSKFINMEIVELFNDNFSTKNDSNLFAFERETETKFRPQEGCREHNCEL